MNEEKKIIKKEERILSVPKNLWDKYKKRLEIYDKQREEIHSFIRDHLIEGKDFGINYGGSEKQTLLKSGAEKISGFIECKIKIYPDTSSWTMLGKKEAVCYVGYLIDQELLSLISSYLLKVGMEYEHQVVKLFAWGEGRGAYELNEKTYDNGKPLKGSVNRAIKVAEKRCKVDVIIGTLGLDFIQDGDEYGKDGQLRGDKKYREDKKTKMTDITSLPEENKAMFHAIMVILNQKKNNKMIFIEKEKTDHIKKAIAIKNNLNDLRGFYNSLNKMANNRAENIKEG